jgi:hypothetical protein
VSEENVLNTYEAHSAEVELCLLINGESRLASQLVPDFLLLDEVMAHPPTGGIFYRWPTWARNFTVILGEIRRVI